MKTKILYVLVSNRADYYYEQLLMSLHSLRIHNKDAYVELVVDEHTADTLVGNRCEYKTYVDKTTTIIVPSEFNQLQKSRYLKTNLRDIISGDFLYIDLDTIICDSLADVDKFDGDICATTNGNSYLTVSDIEDFSWVLMNARKMGYDFIGREYYNAGILYVKDNELTHAFYKEWYDCYRECVSHGVEMDQVSFCEVNFRNGNFIKHMPEYWNCQIQRRGLLLMDKIKIIHYYTNNNPSGFMLAERQVHQKIKETGKISEEINRIILNPIIAFTDSKCVIVGEDYSFLKSPVVEYLKGHRNVCRVLNKVLSFN